MNNEDRYSHLVPMDQLLCTLSPYLRHTTQSIVIKDGKNYTLYGMDLQSLDQQIWL
jgi:hypothetical protein